MQSIGLDIWDFDHLDLLRISDFVFRISTQLDKSYAMKGLK